MVLLMQEQLKNIKLKQKRKEETTFLPLLEEEEEEEGFVAEVPKTKNARLALTARRPIVVNPAPIFVTKTTTTIKTALLFVSARVSALSLF